MEISTAAFCIDGQNVCLFEVYQDTRHPRQLVEDLSCWQEGNRTEAAKNR